MSNPFGGGKVRWQVQWEDEDGARRVRVFEDRNESQHFAANLRDLIGREVVRSPITDINPEYKEEENGPRSR